MLYIFKSISGINVDAGTFLVPPELVGHDRQEVIPLEMKVLQ